MTPPMRIFIGWDSREPMAWSVLAHSIITRAGNPVTLIPLTRASLSKIYTRTRAPNEATEFSLTRFLVPYLSGYEGYSIFMDSDMLCRVDIGEVMLYPMAYPGKAVYVCPHDYVPKSLTKMDGQEQTKYPRKNWTSFCVFSNARCKALTPDYVNSASGLELHRLRWLQDDEVGSIPLTFNWLDGEYEVNPDAKVIHYTNGGPWLEAYKACDHADLWLAERDAMMGTGQAVAR